MICEVHKTVYACFIDYEKAFNRVNHEQVIQGLRDIGINGTDVNLVVNPYWIQRAAVRLERGTSDNIDIKTGVRQGCVLSPSLFNRYTEIIFRTTSDSKGINIGG